MTLTHLLEIVEDPNCLGLAEQLHGPGVQVSYEMVIARTSGTVTGTPFRLSPGKVLLKIGEDGNLEMDVIP